LEGIWDTLDLGCLRDLKLESSLSSLELREVLRLGNEDFSSCYHLGVYL
jgi:hypothetical protein